MLHPRPQSEGPYPQLDIPVLRRGEDGAWEERDARQDVAVDGFYLCRRVSKRNKWDGMLSSTHEARLYDSDFVARWRGVVSRERSFVSHGEVQRRSVTPEGKRDGRRHGNALLVRGLKKTTMQLDVVRRR